MELEIFDKSERYLNQNSKDFFLILNDNELHLFKNARYVYQSIAFEDYLFVTYIAVIYHNKDVVEEENRLETPHYHVVLSLNGRITFRKLQEFIMDKFHCNSNQIGMKKCVSVCGASRYLCHLDDYGKHRYDISEVVTNDFEAFKSYYDQQYVRSLKELICVVQHFNYNLEEVMINIAEYDKWRKYINDLIVNHYRKRL